MNVYIVDFENVHSQGLVGIKDLTEEDRVIVFYSDGANSMTIDLHNEVMETKADVIFKKVYCGTSNALDFQLSSYLGFLLCENADWKYYIVSKDNGYMPVVKFWQHHFDIQQITDLENKSPVEPEKPIIDIEPKPQDVPVTTAQVSALIKIEGVNPKTVAKIINKYKTKTAVNNNLVKTYKGEKAKIVCDAIEPLIQNKK